MVKDKNDLLTIQKSEIKGWMSSQLERNEMTINKWCKLAGVSATTVTEFMSGSRDFLPSITTLTKLSRALGQRIVIQDDSVQRVRLASMKLVSSQKKNGVRKMTTKNNLNLVDPEATVQVEFGSLVETDSMNDAGVHKGDYILCVEHKEIVAQGSIVMIFLEKEGVSPYLYFGHQLVPVSTNPKYKKIKVVDAEIVGYGIQLIRNLTH